jgi:hypothetical protein
MAQAILTAATASDTRQRQLVIEALRYNPFAQMIGQSWRGARILIESDGQDIENVVNGIRSRIESVSGLRYRRDA